MARPTIHPSILADKGVPLTLLGGKIVRLCYGFSALMLLEERFGSMGAAVKVLQDAENGVMDSKMVTNLVGVTACGLAHEVGDEGESLGVPEFLAYYLDTAELAGLGDTIGEAFSKAFPKADPQVKGSESPDPTMPSPGESGTGGGESTSDSEPTSGGA
jgi:hypothetical protein